MFALFAESVDYARARLAEAAAQLIAQGYSYGDIARELGITRQAAWKRFGRKPEVDTGPAESGAAG
jgi:AcrR family transcriptional regulator